MFIAAQQRHSGADRGQKMGRFAYFLSKTHDFRRFAVRNLYHINKNLKRRCIFQIIGLLCLCFARESALEFLLPVCSSVYVVV